MKGIICFVLCLTIFGPNHSAQGLAVFSSYVQKSLFGLTLPTIPNVTLPKLPLFTFPPNKTILPPLPHVTLPKLPDFSFPQVPNLTLPPILNVTLPKLPNIVSPTVPTLPLPRPNIFTQIRESIQKIIYQIVQIIRGLFGGTDLSRMVPGSARLLKGALASNEDPLALNDVMKTLTQYLYRIFDELSEQFQNVKDLNEALVKDQIAKLDNVFEQSTFYVSYLTSLIESQPLALTQQLSNSVVDILEHFESLADLCSHVQNLQSPAIVRQLFQTFQSSISQVQYSLTSQVCGDPNKALCSKILPKIQQIKSKVEACSSQ